MKKILSLFSFVVSVLIAQAQEQPMKGQNRPPMRDRQGMEMPPPPPRPMTKQQRERLESFRIQFITKKLDLTPAEAEKFWPGESIKAVLFSTSAQYQVVLVVVCLPELSA